MMRRRVGVRAETGLLVYLRVPERAELKERRMLFQILFALNSSVPGG